jgi:hypothetical protein
MRDRDSGRFEYIGSVDDCSFMRHSPSCFVALSGDEL